MAVHSHGVGALESAEDTEVALIRDGYDVVRVGYSDVIGSERGRDVLVHRFARTVSSGVAFCRSVYGTTPMGDVVPIEGGLDAGLPDVIAYPDLSTIKPLPWEPGVAHCIADVFNPEGTPSAESPRNVLKRVVERFAALDMRTAPKRSRIRQSQTRATVTCPADITVKVGGWFVCNVDAPGPDYRAYVTVTGHDGAYTWQLGS